MISGPGVVSASASPRTISPGGQPVVDLDRPLRDEGEDRVGAAEGDDRGAGEEQALGGRGRCRCRSATTTTTTGSEPGQHSRPPGSSPCGDRWDVRRAGRRPGSAAAGPSSWPPCAGSAVHRAARRGRAASRQAGRRAPRPGTAPRTGPARGTRRPRARPAPGCAERAAADPDTACATIASTAGASPPNSAVTTVVVAVRHVDRRQREQGEHAGQHEQGAGDEPAAGAVEQPADVDRELLGLGPGSNMQ